MFARPSCEQGSCNEERLSEDKAVEGWWEVTQVADSPPLALPAPGLSPPPIPATSLVVSSGGNAKNGSCDYLEFEGFRLAEHDDHLRKVERPGAVFIKDFHRFLNLPSQTSVSTKAPSASVSQCHGHLIPNTRQATPQFLGFVVVEQKPGELDLVQRQRLINICVPERFLEARQHLKTNNMPYEYLRQSLNTKSVTCAERRSPDAQIIDKPHYTLYTNKKNLPGLRLGDPLQRGGLNVSHSDARSSQSHAHLC